MEITVVEQVSNDFSGSPAASTSVPPTRSCLCSDAPKLLYERLPELVASYARMTTRLLALVQMIGLVAGGQLGTHLAERLGISIPASTLLLHLMKLSLPTPPPVRVLGVDDWSWKKGRRYGAILVE
jgi:hypothetical protein